MTLSFVLENLVLENEEVNILKNTLKFKLSNYNSCNSMNLTASRAKN